MASKRESIGRRTVEMIEPENVANLDAIQKRALKEKALEEIRANADPVRCNLNFLFLTGKRSDLTKARKKLHMYRTKTNYQLMIGLKIERLDTLQESMKDK